MPGPNKRLIDLTGLRFDDWLVIEQAPPKGTNTAWLCVCTCGNFDSVLSTSLRNGTAKRCKECQSAGRSAWVEDGYRIVYYPSHPNARKNGRVAEHVLVMSKFLGRPLVKGENVHHKNGVRDDNRIENLELWVSVQPAGQRPADLLAWAKEIIERYGDGPLDTSG